MTIIVQVLVVNEKKDIIRSTIDRFVEWNEHFKLPINFFVKFLILNCIAKLCIQEGRIFDIMSLLTQELRVDLKILVLSDD
jgi:hypothetical protein